MSYELNLNKVRDELVNVISLFSIRPKKWLSAHIVSESHFNCKFESTSYYWINESGSKEHIFDYYHEIDNRPNEKIIKNIIPLISFQEN